jgi:hypothetical protein
MSQKETTHRADGDFVTVRLHGEDARDLARLCAMRDDDSNADTFTAICAEAVRAALKKEMNRQLRRVELGGEG